MKQNKSSLLSFSVATLAVVAATAGALYYQNRHVKGTNVVVTNSVLNPTPVPGAIFPDPLPSVTGAKGLTASIFRVLNDENGQRLSKIEAPVGTTPDVEGSLNAMAAEKDSPLPPGTRVLSCTESNDNQLATVNFNAAFVKNFPGGDTAEALAIESILATVGQFGPHKVQFLVEGKKIDSLGGNQSLTEPLSVPQSAISEAAVSGVDNAGGGDAATQGTGKP